MISRRARWRRGGITVQVPGPPSSLDWVLYIPLGSGHYFFSETQRGEASIQELGGTGSKHKAPRDPREVLIFWDILKEL